MNKSIDLHIHDGHNSSVLVIDHLTGDLLLEQMRNVLQDKKIKGFPLFRVKKSKEHLNFLRQMLKNIFSTKTVPYFANQKLLYLENFFTTKFPFTKSFFTSKLITKLYLKLSHKKRKKDLKKVLKK